MTYTRAPRAALPLPLLAGALLLLRNGLLECELPVARRLAVRLGIDDADLWAAVVGLREAALHLGYPLNDLPGPILPAY